MADFRKLTDAMSVSPQLNEADFAAAAAQGFKAVICNRPDGEGPDQLPSAQAEDAAKAAGLTFASVPISGAPTQDAVEAMRAALDAAGGPVLAYCKSGTRSAVLWTLAEAMNGGDPDALLAAAAAGGYDLGHLRPTLAQLAAGR